MWQRGANSLVFQNILLSWKELHSNRQRSFGISRRGQKFHAYIYSRCMRLPDAVISNNSTQFTSHKFQMFLENNVICHITLAPFYPSTNGQIHQQIDILVGQHMVRSNKESLWKMDRGDELEGGQLLIVATYHSTLHHGQKPCRTLEEVTAYNFA